MNNVPVVVIGGTGLVGTATVRRLADAGRNVICISRKSKSSVPGVTSIHADLTVNGWDAMLDAFRSDPKDAGWGSRRESLFAGCDLVYLAYQVSEDPQADRRINFSGLTDAVMAFSPRRIIFTSSVSVFGDNPETEVVTESATKVAHSAYAKDKIDAENYIASLQIPSTILNLSIVYGEKDPRVENYRRLLATSYFVFKNGGRGLYNIVHSDDVADAILAALDKQSTAIAEKYIVNAQAIPVTEWFSWIERQFGLDRRPKAPAWLSPVTRGPLRTIISRLGVRAPAAVTEPKASQFERNLRYDSSKIRNELRWSPKRMV